MPASVVKRYYPSLSDLISLTALNGTPLQFVKDALQSIFSKLFYKDLQFSVNSDGSSGYYKLSVVSNSEIAFTLPSTELSLIINKDAQSSAISSFPLSVEYEAKALAVVRTLANFNVPTTFSAFLNLATVVLQLDSFMLLSAAVAFYADYTSASSLHAQLVSALNTKFSSNVSVPPAATDHPLDFLLQEIQTKILGPQNISLAEALFLTFMEGGSTPESWANTVDYFKQLVRIDIRDALTRRLKPRARVSVTFNGHLAVPRKWLTPLDANDEPLPVTSPPAAPVEEPRASFQFAKVDLSIDSQTGLDTQADFSISSSDPVMVGKSGLIIRSFERLKLDLRNDANLPEIAADGRSDGFKGIFLEECEVEFPKSWSFSSSSLSVSAPKIVVKNLIVGNMEGVSGIFSVEGANREKYVPFVVSNASNNLSQFSIDAAEGLIAVTGDDASKIYHLHFSEGEEFYLRDFANHYYHFSAQGVLTVVGGTVPTAILTYEFPNGISISLDSLYLDIQQNHVRESAVVGTLAGPDFEPLRVTLEFDDGFIIRVAMPAGQPFVNNDNVEIVLDGLEFGKSKGEWLFSIAGKASIKKTIPVLSKFLPQYFQLYKLSYRRSAGFKFDLKAGWKNGTTVRGDDKGGITGYIPINLSAENAGLLLEGINFKAKATPNPEIEALLVGAGFKLGPIGASVDDFGARLGLREVDEDEADFGGMKADLSIVGPKGILVDIKTKVLNGAGYLYISDDEYIGALSLTLNVKKLKIDITAVGIITTKMPDGGKGTAVLALLSVAFTPGLPLIWNFELQGVGGLVGIHHTINTTALREGAKSGTLNSILFPVINIKDTSKIVNDLKTVFPVKRDQFLIGLMAKLAWPSGEPTLFIDFGLMVEFSNPVRFAIIGKLAVRRGGESQNSSGDKKLVKINVAFVGIIDFDEKYMSFDASIYDSQIGSITLAGDMAMRLFWGDHKEFLLSIGGFHPAYDVPAYLKLPAKMTRITLCLINKKIDEVELRLILDLYIAITTNTLQFGARLDLYIKFWKLEIIGLLGFDVLFQFKPFRFVSKVYAMLAVLFKGSEILSIGMDMNLVGPGPWHADGTATFSVLGIEKTCKFERTWGDQPQIPAEPPMPIEPLIVQDLQKPESWIAQLPESSQSHVQLKNLGQGALVMDPLGELSISQRTAPLGVNLYKFGEKQLSDPGRYDIAEVVINDTLVNAVTYSATQNAALFGESREDFAPSQFKDMNDEEKLKAESFEYLRSGVKISSGELHTDGYVSREVGYDIVIVDDEYVERNHTAPPFPALFVNSLVAGGALASNPVAITRKQYLIDPLVEVTQQEHRVLASDTLKPVSVGSTPLSAPSLAEALDLQQDLGLKNYTMLSYA